MTNGLDLNNRLFDYFIIKFQNYLIGIFIMKYFIHGFVNLKHFMI